MNSKAKIKRIDKSLPLPVYETNGRVGFDIIARETTEVPPKEIKLVPGNIIVEVPKGYMLMVASRSSTPRKKGLTQPHGLGIIDHDYDSNEHRHRPMTLVLAKNNSVNSIKEALFDRRTIVYWKDKLLGEEQYLRPIFQSSIKLSSPDLYLREHTRGSLQFENHSDLVFHLERAQDNPSKLSLPSSITLPPGKAVRVSVKRDS